MTYSTFSSLPNVSGVYLAENTAGALPAVITSHSTIYAIVSGSTGAYNTLSQVSSLADFEAQFGTSPSENAIEHLFLNYGRAVVFVSRAAVAPRYEVAVDAITAGEYTLSIAVNEAAPVEVTIDVLGTETPSDLAASLIAEISQEMGAVLNATAGSAADTFYIRPDNPEHSLTVSVEAGDLTAVLATPDSPTANDYSYCINKTFDYYEYGELNPGFLICPEAFQALTSSLDRLVVGQALEFVAANKDFIALISSTPASNTVTSLQTDVSQYASPKGHSAFYAPYITTPADNLIAPDTSVAAVALRKCAREGFQQPPAGYGYPINNCKALSARFTIAERSTLANSRVNMLTYERGYGFTVQDDLTLSTNPLYQAINVRVVMNVLNVSLQRSFKSFLFQSVNAQLLESIENTAYNICYALYQSRALSGNTAVEAFSVECSERNNPPDQLENGDVNLTVIVAPTARVRRLLVSTYRVSSGNVQQIAANLIPATA